MAQLPPPVHGAALRNQSLLESKLINSRFDVSPLPLKYIDDMKDMGKFSFKKIGLMIIHAFRMIGMFTTKKTDLVYFTMSPSGGAFYRDILFIFISRLFRKKRLLHFRVKGIKNTSRSAIGKSLVRYAFRGSDIVCLSHHHVEDIAGLFYREPFIVPNGIKVEESFLYLADMQYSNPVTEILSFPTSPGKKDYPN